LIVLDTNGLSALFRPAPSGDVIAWLKAQPANALFITSVTEAELRHGVGLVPEGQRKMVLAARVDLVLIEDFDRRILPFDSAAAKAFADIFVTRRQAGRRISHADGQIAAIARSQGADLATRNVADFEGCGVRIFNPWLSD
jgi:predicted nucleic acid-binding protein